MGTFRELKFSFFIMFEIIVSSFVTTDAQSIIRASYQEKCSKELRCDSRKFLGCANETCDCLIPASMIYDNSTGTCLTLAGERCQYTTTEAEKSWSNQTPCIANSQCRNGVCECLNKFFEISNGTCQPKLGYGTKCESSAVCDNTKHLVCSSLFTCDCIGSRIWSNEKCRSLVETECISNDECVDHAYCDPGLFLIPPSKFLRRCTCKPGYFKAENGTCQLKQTLGGSCHNDSHCLDIAPHRHKNVLQSIIPSFLVCVDGICQCDSKVSTEDRSSSNRFCGKYLDHPCNEGECISGADCYGTCSCKANTHFRTKNDTCERKRDFGGFCQSDNQCLEKFRCDLIKERCVCPVGKSFSLETGACMTSAGAPCKGTRFDLGPECVPNAICTEESIFSFRCKCIDNTVEVANSEGYCYAKENTNCNGDTNGTLTTQMCLPGLTCRNGSCTCPFKDHQVFRKNEQKCKSLVSGPCQVHGDCLDENAECLEENGIKECRCKIGFVESHRQCDIAYGQTCKQGVSKPICDRYAPLECSTKGICECSDFQVYDNVTLTCMGLVGAKCKISENEAFCVDGAECRPFRSFERTFGMCACKAGWETNENRTCLADDEDASTFGFSEEIVTDHPKLAVLVKSDHPSEEVESTTNESHDVSTSSSEIK